MRMIVLIYRETRYSPSSVAKDMAVMNAVAEMLSRGGHEVRCVRPEDVADGMLTDASLVFSMARGEDVLRCLDALHVPVINAPQGVRLCSARYDLDRMLRSKGVPLPPQHGSDGVWVKRGDGPSEVKGDVVLCHTEEECREAQRQMATRGVKSWVRHAHVKGDLVKFYGVEGVFFRHSYPTDKGHGKFRLEEANGKAMHYPFSIDDLQHTADNIAQFTGVKIYGGDAVVRADGSYRIIDFNDWPSFASCKVEAAEAIGKLITQYTQ